MRGEIDNCESKIDKKMKDIELETRLIEFACRVIDMSEKMPKTFAA